MRKRRLVFVTHGDYATDLKGRPIKCLVYADKYIPRGTPARDTATLDELAELCDHDAENCNRHDFCGVHRKLARMMLETGFNREGARLLMRDIAERGGLHGMNGC